MLWFDFIRSETFAKILYIYITLFSTQTVFDLFNDTVMIVVVLFVGLFFIARRSTFFKFLSLLSFLLL